MKKQIDLGELPLEFDLRVSRRARHLRLSVSPDGAVAVTLPYRVPEFWVEKFVQENAEWLKKKLKYIHSRPRAFKLKGNVEEYQKYKEAARGLAEDRLEFFNQTYQVEYKKISIRNQGTRWGSCTRQKTLNFNYKVALLPAHLADYIFVHELCHVQEMNHSARFWAQVARTVPDWRQRRRELRQLQTLGQGEYTD